MSRGWKPLQTCSRRSLPSEQCAYSRPCLQINEADIFRHLGAPARERLLLQLDPETRASLAQLLAYPENTAGSIMTTEFVGVPSIWPTALCPSPRRGFFFCRVQACKNGGSEDPPVHSVEMALAALLSCIIPLHFGLLTVGLGRRRFISGKRRGGEGNRNTQRNDH